MRYDFEDGSFAILKGDDFWATLTLYDKKGNRETSYSAESIFPLMDLVDELKVSRCKKGHKKGQVSNA